MSWGATTSMGSSSMHSISTQKANAKFQKRNVVRFGRTGSPPSRKSVPCDEQERLSLRAQVGYFIKNQCMSCIKMGNAQKPIQKLQQANRFHTGTRPTISGFPLQRLANGATAIPLSCRTLEKVTVNVNCDIVFCDAGGDHENEVL
jgi:hypothetical protein